jgi:hypothetical protein
MTVLTHPGIRILEALVGVADPRMRLRLVCEAADMTFRGIERAGGLAKGSVSAYARGHSYGYPKLRRVVSEQLAGALGVPAEAVAGFLFPVPSLLSGEAPVAGRFSSSSPRRRPGIDDGQSTPT